MTNCSGSIMFYTIPVHSDILECVCASTVLVKFSQSSMHDNFVCESDYIKMPANTCGFRKEWLSKYMCISEGDSKSIAVCRSCKKTINTASMGEAAIASHMK